MHALSALVVSLQAGAGNLVDIVTQGPLPALMLLVGTVLLAASIGIFGLLTLSALAKLLNPTSGPTTRRPPGE